MYSFPAVELGFHSSWKWNDIFSKFPRGMEWNGPLVIILLFVSIPFVCLSHVRGGESVAGEAIVSFTSEFVEGQTIVQHTGKFVDGQKSKVGSTRYGGKNSWMLSTRSSFRHPNDHGPWPWYGIGGTPWTTPPSRAYHKIHMLPCHGRASKQ